MLFGLVWFGLVCSEVVSMECRLFAQLFICVFAHLRIRVVAALTLVQPLPSSIGSRRANQSSFLPFFNMFDVDRANQLAGTREVVRWLA